MKFKNMFMIMLQKMINQWKKESLVINHIITNTLIQHLWILQSTEQLTWNENHLIPSDVKVSIHWLTTGWEEDGLHQNSDGIGCDNYICQ